MQHKKKILFLLLIALLSGCNGQDEESKSSLSEAPSSSLSEPSFPSVSEPSSPADINSPPAELVHPGELTIYESKPNSDIFTPSQAAISADATLLDISDAVGAHLSVEIPIRSISQQKGMVIIDLEGRFIDDHSKEDVQQILTTLAATLQQNHRSFEWIQYQLDGEVGVFGESFEIPPLKLLEGSSEEFGAIRQQIPYEGLRYYPLDNYILDTDETGKRLADYLSLLDFPGDEIPSVSELENSHILYTAVQATQYYTTYPDNEYYRAELKPFDAPAQEILGFSEDWYWMREHVEESIRLLYGNVRFTHDDFDNYRYLEALGVYTPPHMGGGRRTLPAIFSYEDLGDQITAEVAYVVEGMGGYMAPSGDWEEIPSDQLKEYVETTSPRFIVTVKKMPDDWFLLESQVRK